MPLANSMKQRLRDDKHCNANRALLQNDPDANLKGIDRKIDHILRNPKAIPIEVLFRAEELIVVPVSPDEAELPLPEPEQAQVAIADAPPPDAPASLIPPITPVDDTAMQTLVPLTPPKPDISTGPKRRPAGSRRQPGLKRKSPFVPGDLVPWRKDRESTGESVRYCKQWNHKKPCPDNCRYRHACNKCQKPFKKHAAKQCLSV